MWPNSVKAGDSRQPAQITVFVSALLLIILTLLCTTLESARVSALRYSIKAAAESAVFSTFSAYHQQLLEQYHLFFLADDGTLEDQVQGYLSYYENPSRDLLLSGSNFCRFRTEAVNLTDTVYAVEQKASPVETEIMAYMKYGFADELVDQVKELLQISEHSQAFTGIVNQIVSASDRVFGLESQYTRLKQAVSDVKEVSEKTAEAIAQVQSLAEEIKTAEEELNEWRERAQQASGWEQAQLLLQIAQQQADINSLEDQLDSAIFQAERNETVLETAMDISEESIQQIRKDTEELKVQLEPAMSALDQLMPQLSGDLLHAAAQQKETVSDYTEDTGKRKALALQIESHFSSLEQAFANEPALEDVLGMSGEEGERLLEQKLELLLEASELEWPEELQTAEKPVEHDILKLVKQLMEMGILALVTEPGEQLSERLVSMDSFPSEIIGQEAGEESELSAGGGLEELAGGLYTNIVLNEYFLKTMPSYSDSKTDGQSAGYYDLEYVLGSGDTDQENLADTMEQLLLVREGMNLIYLLGDQQKGMEAQALAAALVGALGLAPLAGFVKLLILAAWAFAEAVADVKNLAAGGRVPLLKTSGDWNTSLSQASSLAKNQGFDFAPKEETERGLSYEAYIRLLLCFQTKEKKLGRCMDIIQWNIQQKDAGFDWRKCLMEASFQIRVQADQLLAAVPLVSGASAGTYTFDVISRRSYLEQVDSGQEAEVNTDALSD